MGTELQGCPSCRTSVGRGVGIDIDEHHCPSCGHGVLNWNTTCPGCDQVPWQTPTGQRILQKRLRRSTLLTEGPFVVVVLLFLILISYWGFSAVTAGRQARQQDEVTRTLAEIKQVSDALKLEQVGGLQHQMLVAAGTQRMARDLPKLLAILQESAQPAEIRSAIALSLAGVFQSPSRFTPLSAAQRDQAVKALTVASADQDGTVRAAAMIALAAMQHDDPLAPIEAMALDPQPAVRVYAIQRYHESLLGDPAPSQRTAILNHLVALLHDSDQTVAMASAMALAGQRESRVVPWLIERLQGQPAGTMKASVVLLESVTGQALGADYNAWKQWWDEHKDEALPSSGHAGHLL